MKKNKPKHRQISAAEQERQAQARNIDRAHAQLNDLRSFALLLLDLIRGDIEALIQDRVDEAIDNINLMVEEKN